MINELRTAISSRVPVMHIAFGQRIQDLLGNLMSTPDPIEIKVFGSDQKELVKLGRQVEEVMKKTEGLVDIDDGMITAGPSIVFDPDQEKLTQYHISLTDFQHQLQMYVKGDILGTNANIPEPSPVQSSMLGNLQLGQIQDGEQMRKILLRVTDYDQNNIDKIREQMIFLPDGTLKPLTFFCSVKTYPGRMDLKRENLKSCVVLTSRLNDRDLGSAVDDLKRQFAKEINLPPGYYITYGGAYAEQQKSFQELLGILGTAALLVFTVLLFLFREWMVSLLVLFVSVLGISGCILAMYLVGVPLNVSSYTGIIMIVGIIAENAIFTVNQFKLNLTVSGDPDRAIAYAIALRIRPKLMTALGAILALFPLALGIGLGAQMQQALAVAVIGGFVAGIPLLLFVLPSLLHIIYKQKKSK